MPGTSTMRSGACVRNTPTFPYTLCGRYLCIGGYYVAVAADHIYVDKGSIIGSIGVLMDGFGFTGVMANWELNDVYSPPERTKAFWIRSLPYARTSRSTARRWLDEIHQQFITVVRQGRGKRLKETPDSSPGLWVAHAASSSDSRTGSAAWTTLHAN